MKFDTVTMQIQLDAQTYEALRAIADQRQSTMPAVVGDILATHVQIPEAQTAGFSFIAAGASGQRENAVRHDMVLTEDLL